MKLRTFINHIIKEHISSLSEAMDKGKPIIYTFKTEALTGDWIRMNDANLRSSSVHLIQGKALRGDPFGGVILSIQDTPGSWYVDTIVGEEGKPAAIHDRTIQINGPHWICTNWQDIMGELKLWIESKHFNYRQY